MLFNYIKGSQFLKNNKKMYYWDNEDDYYKYCLNISDINQSVNEDLVEDSKNEINKSIVIYGQKNNEDDNNENYENNNFLDEIEEIDKIESKNGLIINPITSQKSTKDSEKIESSQEEKFGINITLNNYQNQFNEIELKENMEKEHKKKDLNQKYSNNKYIGEYMKRKVKHLVLSAVLDFINNKINEFFNGRIGKGILKRQLLKLNMKRKSE